MGIVLAARRRQPMMPMARTLFARHRPKTTMHNVPSATNVKWWWPTAFAATKRHLVGHLFNFNNFFISETYARNYHPKCANGHQLLRTFDQLNQLSVEVLGQKCEDEFCPQGTKCHQQEQFAYCCLWMEWNWIGQIKINTIIFSKIFWNFFCEFVKINFS